METWFLILVSLSISVLLKSILNHFFTTKRPPHSLPPGPLTFPIIGNFLWLHKSLSELETILRPLHAKLGPIVSLHIGPLPAIFVADRALAHQALIQNGAIYADRPPASTISKIVSSNQHDINTASHGPTWRVLRRNLTAGILHPLRVKSYSRARTLMLNILMNRLRSQAESGKPVFVKDDFQYANFCLMVLMCFGDELDESQIRKVEEVQRNLLVNLNRFDILNFWPIRVSKILLRRLWEEFYQIRSAQENVLIPLIRTRKNMKQEDHIQQKNEYSLCYVDSLLNLELPDENRKLNEGEIVSLCSEFLSAATDTTSTALEWIMANLVKYPHIQEQLFMEIKGVVGEAEEEVKEDDLEKMPFLKAVILEGLRRHPPGHFVLPHAVTQDTVLGKYMIPKNGVINFMVAEMGRDPTVWEDPMAFKPERFVNSEEEFDITGSKEIKMMPFGAGRRICPGYRLAILHLEYFVANLIWSLEWKTVDGMRIDLSEVLEFTVVMKHPLQSRVCPRLKYYHFSF